MCLTAFLVEMEFMAPVQYALQQKAQPVNESDG
jgi:hypothetical protein